MGYTRPHVYNIVHSAFFNLPEEIKHFYQFAVLFTFIVTTGSLYLPIYLYTLTGSMLFVILYILFSVLVRIPLRFISVFILRFGVEYIMFLSVVLLSFSYLLVRFVNVLYYWPVIAILEAVGFVFYWDSHHVSFGLFGKKKEQARELSYYQIVKTLISIISPALSAFFIVYFGFEDFFLVIFIITLVASIYLLRKLPATPVRLSLERVINSPFRRLSFLDGVTLGIYLTTPLYLFIVVGNSVKLFGEIKSFVVAISSVLVYKIGEFFDKHMPLWMGRLVYVLNGVYGILASLFPNVVSVTIAEILRSVGFVFSVPRDATFYHVSRHYPELTLSRSMYVTLGKSVGLSILAALLYVMGESVEVFALGILLAGVVSFISVLLYRDVENVAKKIINQKYSS